MSQTTMSQTTTSQTDESNSASPTLGRVLLVGAGPGDPRYITLRGVDCLRRADVVLYDYLANERLLEHVRRDAELICLGRHGRKSRWNQEAINQELVARARRGQQVVRLKSGDPTIFGRFAEEVGVLEQHQIPFEVVPGISAAIAAGSCVGIPLTHRDMASAVAFVTGQENPAKPNTSVDYRRLASFPGTIVIYMGVTTVARWAPALLEGGLSPQTPVALIRRCSFHDQQVVRCPLQDVVTELTPRTKLPPPVIVVIGEVARSEQHVDWFGARPLIGQAVLVTRSQEQLVNLADQFHELGAGVWHQPAITIGPPSDWKQVDSVIDQIDQFDWLVFASANGVAYLLDRILELGHDVRCLSGLRLAAMGSATAKKLAEYSLRADLVPDEYHAESMVAALNKDAAGKRFLLARASRGRDVLATNLSAAGGDVEEVVVYESHDVGEAKAEVVWALDRGDIDWVTVTSSAIARSLVRLFGQQLKKTKLASISPITSSTLRELGFEPAVEAKIHTMDGLIRAICNAG